MTKKRQRYIKNIARNIIVFIFDSNSCFVVVFCYCCCSCCPIFFILNSNPQIYIYFKLYFLVANQSLNTIV